MDKNFTNKCTENISTDKVTEENNAAKSLPQRRIQDGTTIKNSTRKMNLNRRRPNSDRRRNGEPNHKGPSRRYTIDRRLTTKDRRKTD